MAVINIKNGNTWEPVYSIKGERGEIGGKGDTGPAFQFEDFTEEQLAQLKGDTGETGDEGYTPVRGTDYYTETDIANINSYIDQKITNEPETFKGVLYKVVNEYDYPVVIKINGIVNTASLFDNNITEAYNYLTSVEGLSGLTSLDDNMFNYCTSLQHLDTSNLLTYIGFGALSATAITDNSIHFEALEEIDILGFSNCNGLRNIVLSAINTVGDNAFIGCNNLETITFGSVGHAVAKTDIATDIFSSQSGMGESGQPIFAWSAPSLTTITIYVADDDTSANISFISKPDAVAVVYKSATTGNVIT